MVDRSLVLGFLIVCIGVRTLDTHMGAAGEGDGAGDACTKQPAMPRQGTEAEFHEGIFCVQKGRIPYITSILQPGNHAHVCSGILVDPEFVLTAAHCVDPDSQFGAGKLPFVQIGAIHIDDWEDPDIEVLLVEKSLLHPKWIPDKNQRSPFNVALLKLRKASKHRVPKLLLDHFNLITGQHLAAIGWGFGHIGPDLGADIYGALKVEPQEYIGSTDCNRSTLWGGQIKEGMHCGINQARRASCVVDSGSPLLLLDSPRYLVGNGVPELDFLVGINVDGAPCNELGKPDVYVDTRALKPWIEEGINKSRKKFDEL